MSSAIHLGQRPDSATLDSLADFICGDNSEKFPTYRTGSDLTRFFQSLNINAIHSGTRKWWALDLLKQLQPSDTEKVILRLVDLREYRGAKDSLKLAVQSMNEILSMENLAIGFERASPILKCVEPIKIDEAELLKPTMATNEEDFLRKQFSDNIQVQELKFDAVITGYLQSRVEEAQSCPRDKVALGTIFLLGSTLEGVLLAFALKDQKKYMTSKTAPKDKNNVSKKIYDWKLAELIDVAYEVQDISLDVKQFSHALRDFRNYVHPFHQMSQSFSPDQHTVDICWQVFKAAFYQLKTKV